MNYRHQAASGKKVGEKDGVKESLIERNSEIDNSVVDFSQYGMDMTCCICLEGFGETPLVDNEAGNPYSEVEVVILPCKAHYFH